MFSEPESKSLCSEVSGDRERGGCGGRDDEIGSVWGELLGAQAVEGTWHLSKCPPWRLA